MKCIMKIEIKKLRLNITSLMHLKICIIVIIINIGITLRMKKRTKKRIINKNDLNIIIVPKEEVLILIYR